MTREEIDIIWQRALQAAVADGEQFTRYHFANLVLEAAAETCIDLAGFNRWSDAHGCASAIRSMKT